MNFFRTWFLEIRVVGTVVALVFLLGWLGTIRTCSHRDTQQTVTRLAEHLDGQVERGRYRRASPTEITETDAWGHRLQVEYREEGVGERLLVTSSGRDGSFGTADDIVVRRWLMNAKGIGQGLHDGTASTAKEAAKGIIRGAKEEVKDSVKRAFRRDDAK